MDFLKTRKKAKERGPGRKSPASGPVPPVNKPEPGFAPEASAGMLASAVEELAGERSTPGEPIDPRFTTWRPGTGERPVVGMPDLAPARGAPEAPARDPARLRRSPQAPPARSEPFPAGATAPARPPPRPARADDPLEEFFFREDEEVPALASLPAEAEPGAAVRPEDARVDEYLTFRLGVEEYAVAIERVREVLKSQPITEVPRAPAGVLGVVTVRGEVVAVFDPRRRLGLPGAPPPEGSGRIVIVDDGEGPCGLLVDGVASVVRLARGSIEPCPQGIGGASADCLAGIGRERSRLFTVLELGALLRRAPAPPRSGRAGDARA